MPEAPRHAWLNPPLRRAARWVLSLPPLLALLHLGAARWARWDAALLQFADQQRTPALDLFFQTITRAGSLYLLFPVTTLLAALLWSAGRRLDAWLLWGGLAGTVVITQCTKALVARSRPGLFPPIGETPSDFSFPSAHTAQILAVTLAACLLAQPSSRLDAAFWGAAAALLVVTVGCSRIYLQVHYPSDVFAGALSALCWVLGWQALLQFRFWEAAH
jgi:membrane-associated phospholipid phosphatase